jgi:DNA-binding MarR family transcriptional regulator
VEFVTPTDILESLLVSNHRLTRVAAQSTGIGELATASRISQPAMTKLLPSLVTDELVYRIADVEDSRAWLIAISDKGRDALNTWKRELAVSLEPLFGDLTAREWSTLASAATLLQARLGTAVVA